MRSSATIWPDVVSTSLTTITICDLAEEPPIWMPLMVSPPPSPDVSEEASTTVPPAAAALGHAIHDGIELYVNCIVSERGEGFHTTSLDVYIAALMHALAQAAAPGVEHPSDIRCSSNDAVSYGKWRGALATAVECNLPKPGAYDVLFVEQDEVKQVVVAALAPHCRLIVRGVR